MSKQVINTLFAVAAESVTTEELVEKIREAAGLYLLQDTEKNLHELQMLDQMLLTKAAIKASGGLTNMLEKQGRFDRLAEHLDSKQ